MAQVHRVTKLWWNSFVLLAIARIAAAESYIIRADSRIDSRATDQNFGADAVMRLVINSTTDRDGSIVRGLVALDLPEIAATDIAEARLWMALTRVRGTDGYDPYSRKVIARPLTSGFSELGVTWMSPDLEQESLWTSPGSDYDDDPSKTIEWNPPAGIQANVDGVYWTSWNLLPQWDNAHVRENGLLMTLSPESPPDTSFLTYAFASLDGDANLRPYVEVIRKAGLVGDFDLDGNLTAQDIDLLASAIRAGAQDIKYDVAANGTLDAADLSYWIQDLKKTYFGDANLDGQFDSTDFVDVFQRGEYEDAVAANSGWADGDWDGNGDFESGDFVQAFQGGGYDQGPRAAGAVASVPEPAAVSLVTVCSALTILQFRRRE